MSTQLESRTQACVSTAWIILINKPFYPLYVWALIGAHAALLSCATLLLAPLYFVVPYLAHGTEWRARLALPLVGLGDTIYATKMIGPAAGTELFLLPCALLAIVGFSAREAFTCRVLVVVLYLVYAALHGRYGGPLQDWAPDELARLFSLNGFAVASLVAFIGLRFARVG